MKKHNTQMGGGANPISNKTTSVFKPLIASSLAIALGVSVASATTCSVGSNPLICYGTTDASNVFTSSSSAQLSWFNVTNQTYSPKTGDSTQTFIDNLVFKFTNKDPNQDPTSTATTGIYQEGGSKAEYQKYTISMGAGVNRDVSNNDPDSPIAGATNIASSLKFDAGNKTIKLGQFGDGTITLDFGDFTSNGLRNMEMNFNGNADSASLGETTTPYATPSGNYSLLGNIAILSGDEATYSLNFTNSVRGNITIYTNSFRNWSKYLSGTKGAITFGGNANLEGSIRSQVNGGDTNTTKGGVDITFGTDTSSNNTITGDLSFVNGTNTIEFKGNGTINGVIGNYGSGYVEGAQNNADGTYHEVGIYGQSTVTFGGNATIGGISSASGTNYFYSQNFTITGEEISNNAAQNTFRTNKDQTGDLIFNAENALLKAYGGGSALNSIVAQGVLTLKLAGMYADGNRWGHNHNVIQGGDGSTITIGSKGLFAHWGYELDDQNIIELEGNSSVFKINATSVNNGAGGDKSTAAISTRAGQNVINVHTLTIDQDNSAGAVDGKGFYTEDRGVNTLNANTLTINTTQASVVATDYGSNIFNITGDANINKLVIARSNGTNTLTFNGTTSINAIAAVGGKNDIVFNSTTNTISNGVNQDGNIGTAYSILTYSSGKNFITLKGNNTSLSVGGIYHRWGGGRTQFSVQGDNSTLTIGNTSVDGGAGEGLNIDFSGNNGTLKIGSLNADNSSFTAGTLTNGANIDRGITNITFAHSGTIEGNITTSRTESTTNISFAEGGSITGNITANSGTANIVFDGNGTNTITGNLVANGGINNVTMSGASNTIKYIKSQNNSKNIITIKSGGLSVTQDIWAEKYEGGSQNLITIENGNLSVGGEIRTNNNPSSNKNIIQILNGSLNGKVVKTNSGLNEVVASSSITLQGNSSGIDSSGGTTKLSAETITLKGSSDVLRVSGGELNITAKNLEVIRTTNGSAMWSNNSGRTNIVITNGGHFYALSNSNTTNLALDNNSIFDITFEGNATLKANFVVANGSSQNKNTMNFGNENSTGTSTVTFQGNLTNSSGVGIANIFNFNADSFTFSFKNGSDTYQDLTFGNTRENAINFNANAGVLDLDTSNLSITGNLDINLKTEQASNTIKSTKITTSGTTNINFIADGTILDLFKDSAGGGTFEITDGTSTINFAEGITGTFNGVINATGGNATINIGDGANGIFSQNIKGSGQNVVFLAPQEPTSRADALGGTLTLMGGTTSSSPNSLNTITANGTQGMIVSADSTTNAITSLDVSNDGKVTFYNGTSTISGTTGTGTLELTTKTDAINTNVTLSGANTGLQVLFTGGTEDQRYLSTLTLSGTNTLTSVTSEATNAYIKVDGQTDATITDTTIANNSSLVFAFSGSGNATISSTNITQGDGSIIGISLSGSGTKTVAGDFNIKNATLLVDFQDGNQANGKIGSDSSNPITIESGSQSIINFHGANSGTLNGGITIAEGGKNTVNFLGNAILSGIAFSGGENTINVYDGKTGTINLGDSNSGSQLGNVTNIINLKDNATLIVNTNGTSNTGDGELTANNINKPSTLNFIGDGATFKGSFKAENTGKATINVGEASATSTSRANTLSVVSGTITGEVSNADLKFNAGKSTLALQGATNTFRTLTSGASDGILYLDASTSNVSATINDSFIVGNGTSLTFALVSGGNSSTPTTSGGTASVSVNGVITVGDGGTLGIAIGGDNRDGQRSVTASGGISLGDGSTLRVDFLENSAGTARLGDGSSKFKIGTGRNSEINFYAGSSATLAGGGIELIGGTNTANFYGSATLGQIEFATADTDGNEVVSTNIINIKGANSEANKITATLISDSLSGSNVVNTINLENYAVLNLKADNGSSQDGSGSIMASVNVEGVDTVIQGNLTNSSITFTQAIADLTLQGENTITTLTGYSTPQSYIRHGRVIAPTISNTLILDGSKASSATIAQAVTSNTVGLQFGAGSEKKTFTFSAEGNTISNVSFDSTSASTNNTLAFTNGSNTISQAISIGSGNDLTIALGSTATRESETTPSPVSLALIAGLSDAGGSAGIEVKGNSIISGGEIDISTLEYSATSANLTVQNSSATFDTLTANNASALSLDGSVNAVNVVVTKLNSDNLTANFAGQGESNSATLTISDSNSQNKTITLAGVNVAEGSTYNTLDLSALTQATASSDNGIQVIGSEGVSTDLTIKLADTKLILTHGMTTTDAATTISVVGNETSGNASATISGGADTTKSIQVTNLNMIGAGALQTTLSATNTQISTLTAQEGTSNKLIIADSAKGTIGSIVGETLQVELNGATSSTLAIDGEGGTIKSISVADGANNTLSLQSGKLVVTDAIDTSSVATTKGLNLEFDGNSELSVVNGIDTQTGSGGTINISVKGTAIPNSKEATGEENTPQPIPNQGIISGGDIKIATLSFADNAMLHIRNENATFTTVSGVGVLSLDGANTTNGVTATVSNAIANDTDNTITANFNGLNNKGNELILSETSTLENITFGTNSINNKISISGTKTLALAERVTVDNGAAINFALSNGSTLDFKQGIDTQGTSTITVDASATANNATLTSTQPVQRISDEAVEPLDTSIWVTNLNLISDATNNNSAKLTINASEVTIGTLTAKEGNTTLALDASSNSVLTTLNAISGKTLMLNLTSNGDNEARLALRGKSNTIKSLDFTGNRNVLDLDNSSASIINKVTIASGKTLSVDLATGRYVAIAGSEVNGNFNINFLSGLSEVGGAGVDVKSGGTLNLNVGIEETSGAKALIGSLSNAGSANLTFNGDANTFFFDPASANVSKLDLTTITSNGNNNTVDIASSRFGTSFDVNYTRKDFRVLKVGNSATADSGVTGKTLNFKVFVDKTQSGSLTIGGETITSGNSTNYGYVYSDRVILDNGTQNNGVIPTTHNLLIIPKIDQLGQITYKSGGTEVEGNVAVATVKNDSGISLATEKVVSGFEVIQAELVAVETNEKGNSTGSGYTTYFLGEVKSVGATTEMQEVASTALSINYDLYMANLNSLNKRMGELRDNPYNQGVWARVFGGSQESSFGIGSKTDYVTFQTGYDYDFTLGNAKNYVGVAFSYATSTSKSFSAIQSITNTNASSSNVAGIDNIKSGAYEVAVYNSYVADSGWYNDSIAKFSYIDSTFNLTGSSNESQTTNMAFTLSNEVGYRYKFAESEKGSWYIDPQVELAFGYLNQSDFNSKIASSAASSGYSTLDAYQDAILTLRTRVGASLGKKFNTTKGFASLYVGAFYEYDYIEGGASNVEAGSGAGNNLTPLSSNGRAVLNVGSNIALTENARLYIDVEKSFGDQFKTNMQFNFGARYSFGEKTPAFSPQEQQKPYSAPLKIKEDK